MSEREYYKRIAEFHKLEGLNLKPDYPKNDLRIELSNICNHKCLFCANRKMTRKKGFMEESFFKLIMGVGYWGGLRGVGFLGYGVTVVSPNF